MAYKILEPLLHGTGAKVFSLHPGEVVEDELFTKDQAAHLVDIKCIEACVDPHISPLPEKKLESSEIPELPDILSLTVAEAKEMLNDETDIVKLHRFLDAENADNKPRKGILEFIELRIKELTGFE